MRLLFQVAYASPVSLVDQPAPTIGPARTLRRGEAHAGTTPTEHLLERLEAAPDEPPVDLVRLKLLRDEIRRWTRDASIPDEDSFDDWAFGDEQGEKQFREKLDALLRIKIQVVDRVFQLTEPQRRKLTLAGRGDIKHLLEGIDESRREFDRACQDIRRLPELQNQLRQIELRIRSGPFEAGSILAKTLRKMFDKKELTARPATSGQ